MPEEDFKKLENKMCVNHKDGKWEPRTKRAKALWATRIKQSKEDLEFSKEWYIIYRDGRTDEDFENNDADSRQIVYMTDGMYVTNEGIVLFEEDAHILEF